ncbi:MAG: hypothetical protein ACLSHG_10725 [Oscillospiraceae bacterium]
MRPRPARCCAGRSYNVSPTDAAHLQPRSASCSWRSRRSMAVFVCVWDERKYYLTSLLLVGLMFVPFVLRFEGRRPQARELVLPRNDDGAGRGRARGVLLAAAVRSPCARS